MSSIPELDRKGLRDFGLMFGAIVAALFGVVLPWVVGYRFPTWPWIVLSVFTAWSLLAPASLRPFYRIWMRLGLVLNAVMSRIVLGFVFYLVVFPTGLILRLRGRDPMRRQFQAKSTTYRVESHKSPPSQMEKPF